MKRLKISALLMALLMVVSACGGGSGNSSGTAGNTNAGGNGGGSAVVDAETGTRDDLTLSLWFEPLSISTAFSNNTVGNLVSNQICEPLVQLNSDGSVSPLLASSWEFVNDGKDIEFELRSGVTFSNGDPLTADDVVFTYDTAMSAGIINNITGVMEKMEKIDDTHVRLTFQQVYGPALLCVASLGIFPQSAYEANADAFSRNPVGSGPYKLVAWNTGDSIVLTANENYWGGAPAIKDVTFKIITDDTAAAIALESGEIDVLTKVPSTELTRLQNNSNLQISSVESLNGTWIFFNHEGIFADEKVRLAVAYALNKDDIMVGATDGNGNVAQTIFPSFMEAVDPDYVAPTNDPEKAKQLLAEAGYPNGFDVNVKVSNDSATSRALEVAANQLAQVGINITIEKIDSSVWATDVFETGDYTLGIVNNTLAWPDMDDMNIFYRSGAFLNMGHVEYDDLDVLWDGLRSTAAGPERTQIGYELCRYLGDHGITVPLYSTNNSIAANGNLKGISACSSPSQYLIMGWSW